MDITRQKQWVFRLIAAFFCISLSVAAEQRPNIILIMADDLGWGDVGFNGNTIIKTPHLDQMAAEGIQFNRFYSASAVCSPTRASCLTGRNPYRTGVFNANVGILRPEEVTLPEILKAQGYATGHFGKWHLGTLTKTEQDANRGGPENEKEYNPPKEHGYDTAFVTESKVPTYDPMKMPGRFEKDETKAGGWAPLEPDEQWEPFGTYYWDINGSKVTDNLDGNDSRVIMDRVLPFIDKAGQDNKPFLSVIWFHAPHLPCVAGPAYQQMYADHPLQFRNYAGCITAMDEQIGRLRAHLKERGLDKNTMIWFCSDNGPEGRTDTPLNGTAGPFRGRKRDLYEGGVRVPGLLVWPDRIGQARKTDVACITSDYLPTILDATGIAHPEPEYALDGCSLMPLVENKPLQRPRGLGFMINKSVAWQDGHYKIISANNRQNFQLYDLANDPSETNNIATEKPQLVQDMKQDLLTWNKSVEASFTGDEYGTESVRRMGQRWPSPLASQER